MESTQTVDAMVIEGGFSDPVFNAQSVFDRVMNAMAQPGTIVEIPALASAPAPITSTTAALLLTLCDSDTPVWFDGAETQAGALRDWVVFQTGAPFAEHPADAHFAIVTNAAHALDLVTISQGTQVYPDRSTTMFVQVNKIEENGDLILEGPGIKGSVTLGLEPLSPFFMDRWAANNARFPRGVDIIFTCRDKLVCLPRTTRISIGTA